MFQLLFHSELDRLYCSKITPYTLTMLLYYLGALLYYFFFDQKIEPNLVEYDKIGSRFFNFSFSRQRMIKLKIKKNDYMYQQ